MLGLAALPGGAAPLPLAAPQAAGGRGRPASASAPRGAVAGKKRAREAAAAAAEAAADRAERGRFLERRVERFAEIIGERGKGVPVTEIQAVAAITGYLLYDGDGKLRVAEEVKPVGGDAERFRTAQRLSGLAPGTAKKVVEGFFDTGEVFLELPGARGPGKLDEDALNALEPAVKAWVKARLANEQEPFWITRKAIQDFIYVQSGVFASFKRITGLCASWGLVYGRLERSPKAHDRRRFLLRRIALLQWRKHIAANHDITEMDESYDNTNKALDKGWHFKGQPFAAFARKKGAGAGPRLCWAHAFGPMGFCAQVGAGGGRGAPSDW